MDEEFESLVVTDPDLVDEGIDVSGLRTQTDVSPYLLGNIPDYAGIQYEAFNPNRLSDLMRLYSSGLPAIDTAQIPGAVDTLVDTGDGGQATAPVTGDSTATPIIPIEPGTFTAESLDESFAGEEGPITQPVTGGITGDTILMENIGSPDLGSATEPVLNFGEFAEFGPVTMGGAPVVSQQLQDQGPTTIEGPLSQVQVDGGLSAIDEERLAGYTPSFDTSGLTDATPEQRNTIQNILTAAGDNVQGALTELGKIPGAVVDFANQTVDFFGKKLNVGKTLASIALNKIAGGPVSLLFDILPQDSLENRTTRSIVDELKAEKDYGFNVQTGTLNQDPFGRNPVSQFGNYEQTLTEDINDPSDTRMGKAKKEFAQDYFDKKAEKAGGVEVDEGTVLGPGEAPGDVVSLDDMLREQRDEKIDEGIQAADDDKGSDIDTFDTTPVDEFSDEAFMVGDTSTAAPTTGDSGADSFFDAVDTITGGGGGRDRDPDPSPSFDPGQGFVDQGGGGEFGGGADMGSVSTAGQAGPPSQRGGGGNGGSSSGGGGCVIATHAVNSGAFTKDIKREAVRWCVKNLHRTWWGEAIRRGYRYYGQKAIEEGKAKNHYQEFKDYVAFGTGKRRTLKTGWTFVYRSIQFFIRGLING
jgi:hypothetical protein